MSLKTVHIFASSFNENENVGAQRPISFATYLTKNDIPIKKAVINTGAKGLIATFFYILKHRKEHFIYTVGPFANAIPFIISGLLLKVNLYCDIRDPLYLNNKNNYGGTVSKSYFHYKTKLFITKLVEWFIFKTSKKVIVCTPGLLKVYSTLFPKFSKKLTLITNGHTVSENEIIQHKKQIKNNKKYKLVCLGKFFSYGAANSKRTLDRIIEQMNAEGISDFELVIYGENKNKVSTFIKSYPQYNFIKVCDRIPLKDVHVTLKEHDYAVQVIRDENFDLGTKFFNYCAAGLPIINSLDKNNEAYAFMKFFLNDYKGERPSPIQYNREKILKSIKFEDFFASPKDQQ